MVAVGWLFVKQSLALERGLGFRIATGLKDIPEKATGSLVLGWCKPLGASDD
jgi:hypothetical protein